MYDDIRNTQLWKIVSPYDNWYNTLEMNDEAKLALKSFLIEYNSNEIEKVNNDFSEGYLRAIRNAIAEEKYERACNELCSLMYYTSKHGSIFANNIAEDLNELLEDL